MVALCDHKRNGFSCSEKIRNGIGGEVKKDKLGKHISIISGYPFKSELFNSDKEGLPLIRVRDVNSGFAGIYYSGDYPTEYLIRKNELLIGLDGDFNCVRWSGPDALLNQRVCKIQLATKELDEKYFYYFMPIALSEIHSNAKSSAS